MRLNRDEGHSVSDRVVRRCVVSRKDAKRKHKTKVELNFGFSAQVDPYPQVDPARVSKNRSPPPRSISRSASTTSEFNPTETNLSRTKSSNNRRSRLRTANRRVHFPPEVDNEQATDPKDDATSDDPVTPKSPARELLTTQTTEIPHGSKRPSSRMSGTSTFTAFHLAPTQHLSAEEEASVIEETSSGESEVPDNHTPDTVQTRVYSRKGNSIRSGIKDLLEVNKEAPVVDANTATILESLLSQIDQDSNDRSVLSPSSTRTIDSAFRASANPGPAGLALHIRTGARFVERLNSKPFSLTAHPVTHGAKRHPHQHGPSANSNLL